MPHRNGHAQRVRAGDDQDGSGADQGLPAYTGSIPVADSVTFYLSRQAYMVLPAGKRVMTNR